MGNYNKATKQVSLINNWLIILWVITVACFSMNPVRKVLRSPSNSSYSKKRRRNHKSHHRINQINHLSNREKFRVTVKFSSSRGSSHAAALAVSVNRELVTSPGIHTNSNLQTSLSSTLFSELSLRCNSPGRRSASLCQWLCNLNFTKIALWRNFTA